MDDRSLFPDTIIQSYYVEERFMADAYQISKLERFGSGNAVSLTLGLQGGSLPGADETSPNFVTMRGNDVYTVLLLLQEFRHRDFTLQILEIGSMNLSHRVFHVIL